MKKQFTTYIPTFGVGTATGYSRESVMEQLEEELPQFKGQIVVEEAGMNPLLESALAGVTEDDLI